MSSKIIIALTILIFATSVAAIIIGSLAYTASNPDEGTFESIEITDTTNQIVFGEDNTTTLSAPAGSTDTILTLPIITDTLVGTTSAQTLTNKTLTTPIIVRNTAAITGATTLTSATSGTLYTITGGTYAITLPLPITGVTYMFVAGGTPTGSGITITATGALVNGVCLLAGVISACVASTTTTCAATQCILGDSIEYVANGTNWVIRAFAQQSGAFTF